MSAHSRAHLAPPVAHRVPGARRQPIDRTDSLEHGTPAVRTRRARTRAAALTVVGVALAACSSPTSSDQQARDLGLGQYASPTPSAAATSPTAPAPTSAVTSAVSPTPSSSPSAAASPDSVEVAAAKTAYNQMFVDQRLASKSRDESLLSRHATGAALARLKLGFDDSAARHFYIEGDPITSLTLVAQGADRLTLHDCSLNKNLRYVRTETGKVLGRGQPYGTAGTVVAERQPSGEWKIANYTDVKEAKPCAPAG